MKLRQYRGWATGWTIRSLNPDKSKTVIRVGYGMTK